MKPYGQKQASKVCECIQCGKSAKANSKKRERQNNKKCIAKEISKDK